MHWGFEFVAVSGVFHNNCQDPHKRHGRGKLHSRQYRLVPVDLPRPNQIWQHGRKAVFLDVYCWMRGIRVAWLQIYAYLIRM